MPIYTYQCECGNNFQQFLREDKATVLLKCQACARTNTARQIIDKSVQISENNEVRGVLRHDNSQNTA